MKNKAAAQLGSMGGKAYVQNHGREAVLERLAKARKVRFQKSMQRKPVENLDEPEKNCSVCGFDHSFKTDMNAVKYCDKCNPDIERNCPKDNFKYMPGGKCPCWR